MIRFTSFVLTLSMATSGLANYAQLLHHYPTVKECFADKHELSLVPAEQQRVALQVLSNNAQPSTENIPNRDAKLFGPTGEIAAMGKTQTAFGHAVMASMLANNDTQQTQSRQNVVRLIAQNSQLADELATHLKRFAEAEAVFLKFYKDTNVK